MKTSRIPEFYKLSLKEKLEIIRDFAGLNEKEMALLSNQGFLGEFGERMIENVVGLMPLPIGIAANFLINGKDYLIPMAIEESSVVAAASNAAKIAREKGGFRTSSTTPVMIGQIQLTNVSDPLLAKSLILNSKQEILGIANKKDPLLANLGGGAKDLEVRIINSDAGPIVVIHLLINVKDAMGANIVNTMAEAVGPFIGQITGGKACLRIVSNLATSRLAFARAVFGKEAIGGEKVVDGIINAYSLAKSDSYRCATHNKGIMNGIDAVLIATGNDFRAVEAGAHTYAGLSGKYLPLTDWEKNKEGDLVGSIKLPLAVGIVGGATIHPIAKINLKILGVKTANELAEIIAAVGLSQNFAALRALATEGIQKGHMRLHLRKMASTEKEKDSKEKIEEILGKEKIEKIEEIGISQIGIALPKSYIKVEKIAQKRGMDSAKALKGLLVKEARIPYRENLSQLAKEAIEKIKYQDVKTFFFATESNSDSSKPEIALKSLEMLGLHNVMCIPTTFACVSGIQSVIAACQMSASTREPIIVVAVDRSIYQEKEPEAEVTEGCAAIALRITPAPKLLQLDYLNYGIYVTNLDDFKVPWKSYPLPKINGALIKISFLHCVKQALLDWEAKNQELVKILVEKGQTVIDYLDFIDFHCPFLKMTEWATASLWQHYKFRESHPSLENVILKPDLFPEYKVFIDRIRKIPEFQKFYEQKIFSVLNKYNPRVGNPYNGSIFIGLAAILEQALPGQIIGINGYGSGAGSVVLRGKVMGRYSSDLKAQLEQGRELSFEEYEEWRKEIMK